MNDEVLFFRGGSRHLRKKELEQILFDLLDVSLYNRIKAKFETPKRNDLEFNSNESFWNHITNNSAYTDQYIALSNFYLTEWLPMSPGLFHTREAELSRRHANKSIIGEYRSTKNLLTIMEVEESEKFPIKDRVAVELNPDGKMDMVLGGIGALRLEPKKLFDNEKVFLLGASSNGICHEGIPVVLSSDLYLNIIDQIKENCGLRCKLTGRLTILPTSDLPIEYSRMIPKYCLFVEEIKNIQKIGHQDILISIAITFSPSLKDINEKKWSFVSFNPDKKDRQLIYSVEWLFDYAKRYSGVQNPIVLNEFDEIRQHFEKLEFSLKDIANGKIDLKKLARYEDFLNFKIITIMGDNFENISNSTIINKSSVQNAFNSVKDKFGEDTAKVLAQIAGIIEKSGNKEAGDVFNAFNEEIQKPEPKKSILKTFWDGLIKLLPTIGTIGGIAETILKIIG